MIEILNLKIQQIQQKSTAVISKITEIKKTTKDLKSQVDLQERELEIIKRDQDHIIKGTCRIT